MIRIGAAAVIALLGATASAGEWSIVAVRDQWAQSIEKFPDAAETAHPLWIWSNECAPVRLLSNESPRCAEPVERKVRVTVPPRHKAAGLELRWGTEAMLRELPDLLLPLVLVSEEGTAKLPVPKGQSVFARVAGPKLASGWTLLGENTRIAAVAAVPVSIAVAEAEPAWVEIRTSDVPQPRGLGFRGAGRGRVLIPPIPAESYVRLVAWSETKAPSALSARADALPHSIELPAGPELRGVVTDDEDQPVAAAAVETLFVISREELTIRKTARSAADGTFRVRGLRAGDVELSIAKEPFATKKEILRVAADTDAGRVMLDKRRAVTFVVLDPDRTPIAEAAVEAAAGPEAATNEKGTVTLKGVPASSFDVSVSARGYLPRTASVAADAKQTVAIELERAAQVRARLVDRVKGMPVDGGTVAIEIDQRMRIADFEGDRIEITDLTAGTLALEIRPHSLTPFRLPERQVAAGEIVDLGTIQLEPGIAITGRIVDAASHQALAGVSVRVLRPSAFGALLSWFRRDVVSAQSAADGAFRVSGLAPGTYALWTEAPGRAPAIKTGIVLGDEVPNAEFDLGELLVEEGRRVIVTCTPAERCGAEAIVTPPDAEWFEISGVMIEGRAEISPVPSGAAALRLSDRGGVIHQRDITVKKDAPTEVRVRLEGASIAGRVRRAGRPVSGGSVMFTPPGAGSRFIQVAQRRPSGVISNEILGSVPRRLTAIVDTDGTFALADVPAGQYTVTWTRAGAPSAPRNVVVPEGTSEIPLLIELGSASLAGMVRRTDGSPVSGAVVQVKTVAGDAQAITGEDGTFSYTALDPGQAKVRALARSDGTADATVELEEGKVAEVELKVRPENRREARVLVLFGDQPVSNAFVFAARNGRVSAATTSADGRATVRLFDGDDTVQIAVYNGGQGWTFVPPRAVGGGETVVETSATAASLLVHSGKLSPLFITAPTGFPIHEALAILGSRPVVRPDVPYVLQNLAAGTYSVSAGGVMKTVTLANKPTDLRF